MDALPAEAAVRQPAGYTWEGWDNATELLAQLVEVVSITAMENTVLREAVRIPRPERLNPPSRLKPANVVPDPEWSAAADAVIARLPARRMGG